ncbi:MAG: SPFH domain-containing protein, partial [Xanthomonadales bacterium]|nr:SPFH domain-containing protein [Xanthomonadales bacterium]
MREISKNSLPGIATLLGLLVLLIGALALFVHGLAEHSGWETGIGVLAGLVLMTMLAGFYTIEPNQAGVLSLFGRYVGTVKESGLRWNNPFFSVRKVSLRVRNFESGKLK